MTTEIETVETKTDAEEIHHQEKRCNNIIIYRFPESSALLPKKGKGRILKSVLI